MIGSTDLPESCPCCHSQQVELTVNNLLPLDLQPSAQRRLPKWIKASQRAGYECGSALEARYADPAYLDPLIVRTLINPCPEELGSIKTWLDSEKD